MESNDTILNKSLDGEECKINDSNKDLDRDLYLFLPKNIVEEISDKTSKNDSTKARKYSDKESNMKNNVLNNSNNMSFIANIRNINTFNNINNRINGYNNINNVNINTMNNNSSINTFNNIISNNKLIVLMEIYIIVIIIKKIGISKI